MALDTILIPVGINPGLELHLFIISDLNIVDCVRRDDILISRDAGCVNFGDSFKERVLFLK